MDNFARIADDDTVARHIEIDVCVGRDERIVANGNPTDHDGVRAYPDLIAYRWRAFTLAAVFPPDRHPGCNIAVFSDLRFRVNDDRSVVPDKETFADLRLNGDMKGVLFIQNFQPICIV